MVAPMTAPTMMSATQPVEVKACSFLPSTQTKMRRSRAAGAGEAVKVASTSGEEPPDRRKLCEDMLQQGFVQSFVDFFYLTHRPDPKLMEQRGDSTEAGETSQTQVRDIEVSSEDMVFLRDNLAHGEAARRKGETALVYSAFSNLARYFQEEQRGDDPKTGVYFYEKCHEIARLTGDHRGEMAANHDLGLAHARVGDTAGATRHHERHLEMARSLEDEREIRLASKELIGVYRAEAEAHEARDDAAAAAVEFDRCLRAARDAGDAPAEARAALSLGRALVLEDQGGERAPSMVVVGNDAVRILEGAELLCRELGDAEGEGRACAALAAAWRARGDDDRAGKYLERCLDHSVATDDLAAQASACATLGALHAQRRDFDRAVELLERNFKIARQLLATGHADAALVDRARVDLGIAIGNATLKRYLRALNADFGALLLWKNSREPLPTGEDDDLENRPDDEDNYEEAKDA